MKACPLARILPSSNSRSGIDCLDPACYSMQLLVQIAYSRTLRASKVPHDVACEIGMNS